MNLWRSEYNRLRNALEELGWQGVKDEASGLERWYSQGVLYFNFTKKGQAVHIEYGDEGIIFGEKIEG